MASVNVSPELVTAAAQNAAGIGATLSESGFNALSVVAAADDEVSTAIAAVFSAHGQAFQALRAQAATFHTQFVQALSEAAAAYAAAEAAIAQTLQSWKFPLAGSGNTAVLQLLIISG